MQILSMLQQNQNVLLSEKNILTLLDQPNQTKEQDIKVDMDAQQIADIVSDKLIAILKKDLLEEIATENE